MSDENLARDILFFMVSENRSFVSIDYLRDVLSVKLKVGRFSKEDLWALLKRYDDLFKVSRDRNSVDLIVPVKLCPDYCSEDSCRDSSCMMFHICRFFILSDTCTRPSSKPCKFGHSLESPHNRRLLRKLLLDKLPFHLLQTMFCLPGNRTEASTPRICSFYNVHKGCSKRDNCTSLHVCGHFIFGTCKFSDGCNRSHDIRDIQPLLHRYGIRVARRNQKDIVLELRDMMDDIEDNKAKGLAGARSISQPFLTMNNIPRSSRDPTLNRQQGQTSARHARSQSQCQSGQVGENRPRKRRRPRGRGGNERHDASRDERSDVTSAISDGLSRLNMQDRPYLQLMRNRRTENWSPQNRNNYRTTSPFPNRSSPAWGSAGSGGPPKKQKICRYYQKGYCRYKSHCKDLHVEGGNRFPKYLQRNETHMEEYKMTPQVQVVDDDDSETEKCKVRDVDDGESSSYSDSDD